MVIIKNTQCITPPPSIAQTLAQNSRDYLQKYGHVTNQLRKAVKVLLGCLTEVCTFTPLEFDFFHFFALEVEVEMLLLTIS